MVAAGAVGMLGIPFSIGGFVGLFINVLIVFAAIMLSNKLIAHEMEIKRAFIMAFIAYLVTPIILIFLAGSFSFPFMGYVLPLVVWIALGEVLLKADVKVRLEVAIIAFVIYTALTFAGLPAIIALSLPF